MFYDNQDHINMHPFHFHFHPFGSSRQHHGGHHHDHHHGGHHFGRHGHGMGRGHGGHHGLPGGPGPGLGGFERGRKLGSDDLQLLILALLAQRASHGYELIKEFDQRSGGYYVPSPGMIYPALSYLEEVGYASVEVEGAKKRYSVTVAGLAQLDEHRSAVEAMWAQLATFGERMARLREDAPSDDALQSPGRRGRHDPHDALHAAVDALRTALHDRHHAAPDERNRIAALLAEVTAAILRGGKA